MNEVTPLLHVHNLSKRFGAQVALERIAVDVLSGETVAIMGTNGSGKTTLFDLISRVVDPDEGVIEFAGENVLSLHPHEPAERGVARIYQSPQLCGELTVRENVSLGSWVRRGLRPAVDRSTPVTEALELVGLSKQAAAYPQALNLYEQRCVELARSLVAGPSLLLLDELTTGLSNSEREGVATPLSRSVALGTTLVMIEHDPWLLERFANRVLVLNGGRVVAEGDLSTVLASAPVRALSEASSHVAPFASQR